MTRAHAMFALLTIATPVWAAEDDGTMGDYLVAFAATQLVDEPFEFMIVADGSGKFHAVIFVGDYNAIRNEIPGAKVGANTTFEGSVDLGPDLGGKCTFKATVVAGVLTGEFSGESAPGAFKGKRIQRTSPTLGAVPPHGAKVLFDGSNLDNWVRHPEKWVLTGDKAFEVAPSNLVTKDAFGDMELHLEFRCPFMPGERGQARGNSGVYIHGRYEVQVLDSYGLESLDNDCSGIYKMAKPLRNACFPPLSWQSYDINFKAPTFDAAGKKTRNAIITVRQNGVVVHDNLEIAGTTPGGVDETEAPTGRLLLQDHRNQVQYRNIWVLEK